MKSAQVLHRFGILFSDLLIAPRLILKITLDLPMMGSLMMQLSNRTLYEQYRGFQHVHIQCKRHGLR